MLWEKDTEVIKKAKKRTKFFIKEVYVTIKIIV